MLPRGNGTLMLRIAFHDYREKLYKSVGKLAESPTCALAFLREYIDRTEGRPGRAGANVPVHPTKFGLQTRDGQEVEILPNRPVSSPGSPAASQLSAEDALILQARVVPPV